MIDKLYEKIIIQIDNKYWTNFLGLSRSVIALSTLLTLIFNSTETLFYLGVSNEISIPCTNINNLSVFCVFENLNVSFIVSFVILFFVIIGWYPRITCIFHWWITYSFATTSFAVDGGDQVASIITLLLIPICLFDKRKWHWSIDTHSHNFYAKSIAYFSYLLISLQVFIIYFHAATGKFFVEEWINGTALYYWFYNSFFGMNDYLVPIMSPVLKSPILATLLTWSVLVLELSLAFGIFFKKKSTKFIFCFAGIFFHFFIMLFHGLVSFFMIMSAALILFFLAKSYNLQNRKIC